MNFSVMVKLTDSELNQIRKIKIHQIINLTENGRRINIRCPFPDHNDTTPSFALYPQNDYFCFGCGKTGQGAIDFIMDFDCTFIEACEELIKYI